MSEFFPLGTCTIELGPTATATDFAGEFIGLKIVHGYEDVGEKRHMLDDTIRGATRERADGVSGNCENDLTGTGLYAYLNTHDLEEHECTITHLGSGATWVGSVTLTLPTDIGADEWGAPVASSIEWTCVRPWTYTAGTVTP